MSSRVDEFFPEVVLSSSGFLRSIEFNRDVNEGKASPFTVLISLSNKDKRLSVLFRGVFEISVGLIDNGFNWMLSVKDVSSHQIEGAKYLVSEEEGLVKFYCSHFEIVDHVIDI